MKQLKLESVIDGSKTEEAIPAPPPPPLLLPRFWGRRISVESVTNQEIAKFWRQKRTEEQDHLLAAIKAAARIRACNLSEDDYKRFEESLKNEDEDIKEKSVDARKDSIINGKTNEVQVGIKDWWTKSKYAYLNQPAIDSMMDPPKRRASTYVPNCLSYKPTPLYPTSLGVF